MKKILSMILVLCMALALVACGGNGGSTGNEAATEPKGVFKAGFGLVDITPEGSVPLGSYGDSRDRMSTGMYSYLEARAVAVQDENGDLLIFVTGDLSWCPNNLGTQIRTELASELSIPENHIVLSGTHTHASVDTGLTDIPTVAAFNKQYIAGMKQAAKDAVADLKPAEVYVGRAYTENLNFVKRYYMDDGSITGDVFRGTGTKIVSHESDPDNEVVMMKLVREGGKDILLAGYQAHPHMEGKTTNLSAQVVGAFRDAIENDLDVHCLAWNGAAGNLNSSTRIEEERRTTSRTEWGQILADYVKAEYNNMTKVNSGPVEVAEITVVGNVNHEYDHLVSEATQVKDYYSASGYDANATMDFAAQWGIHSYQHATRILANFKLPSTQEIYLFAWSFGDIAGVVLPYEMYDYSGMTIKTESPFNTTFIVGYSYPSYIGYVPAAYGYERGGYEADNSTFQKGTAEMMVENWLNLLNGMYEN